MACTHPNTHCTPAPARADVQGQQGRARRDAQRRCADRQGPWCNSCSRLIDLSQMMGRGGSGGGAQALSARGLRPGGHAASGELQLSVLVTAEHSSKPTGAHTTGGDGPEHQSMPARAHTAGRQHTVLPRLSSRETPAHRDSPTGAGQAGVRPAPHAHRAARGLPVVVCACLQATKERKRGWLAASAVPKPGRKYDCWGSQRAPCNRENSSVHWVQAFRGLNGMGRVNSKRKRCLGRASWPRRSAPGASP